MAVVFNRSVQRDVSEILAYYTIGSGPELADEFFEELMLFIGNADSYPKKFH